MAERRRSFAPTVLVGPGGAALAAVAATRTWATASGTSAGVDVTGHVTGSTSAPLAVALALVALASWGVVLVLRGVVRRAAAVVGVLASAGALTSSLTALDRVRDDAVDAVVANGGTGDAFTTSLTGWYWICLVALLLCLLAFAVAVVAAPGWPAMGSRYDSPSARAVQEPGPGTEQDLWRALDEGRDPTD